MTQSPKVVDQDRETPVVVVHHPRLAYRYAYVRARDARQKNGRGEDYLVVDEQNDRLVFALCDGVGQSFRGDIGARILGNALIQWLVHDLGAVETEDEAQNILDQRLRDLTVQANAEISQTSYSQNLPEMVVKALERKRAIGSESTFVAGFLDLRRDRLLLTWMGDSQLHIWQSNGQPIALGDTFQTSERWSSRKGPVGRPHVRLDGLSRYYRILAYSDGLNAVSDRLGQFLNNSQLTALLNEAHSAPASDDISFFEVCFDKKSWKGDDLPDALAIVPVRSSSQSQEQLPNSLPSTTYSQPDNIQAYDLPRNTASDNEFGTEAVLSSSGGKPSAMLEPFGSQAKARTGSDSSNGESRRVTTSYSSPTNIKSTPNPSHVHPRRSLLGRLIRPTLLLSLCTVFLIGFLGVLIWRFFLPDSTARSITIESPEAGMQVTSPLTIRGQMTDLPSSGNRLTYFVVSPLSGQTLGRGIIEVTSQNNQGTFSAPIHFQIPQQGRLVRIVLVDINWDNAPVAIAQVDVRVADGQSPAIRPH